MQMSERPDLNEKLDGETFRTFYYLKKSLLIFAEKTICLFRVERLNLLIELPVFLIRERC